MLNPPVSSCPSSACAVGYFKPVSGSVPCSVCPSNSRTSQEGSRVCECRSGFYRAANDANSSDCTSELCLFVCFRLALWEVLMGPQWGHLSFTQAVRTKMYNHWPKSVFFLSLVFSFCVLFTSQLHFVAFNSFNLVKCLCQHLSIQCMCYIYIYVKPLSLYLSTSQLLHLLQYLRPGSMRVVMVGCP